MYLYLGQDTVIKTRDVVGIFDLDNTSVSKDTRNFLKFAEKQKRVQAVSEELPKSFVVCEADGTVKNYLSQVAPATLLKRSTLKLDALRPVL